MKTVLLVEDNEDDILLTKLACERSGIPHRLDIVTDGYAAVDYLTRTGIYADCTHHFLPDLIFLDVKLPKRSGMEVLEWIRGRPKLANIPIIMLTNSSDPADIHQAYKLGVTSYLLKTADAEEFKNAVRLILKYWILLNMAQTSDLQYSFAN
ncbi:MAG: putative response regulator, CheY [Pedosphaera sp.]|jgi:CheY-like chemotaxis protein|nr:putative response regulator, CheY [Pedosphaera sp.]